jgi:hypothetical protein
MDQLTADAPRASNISAPADGATRRDRPYLVDARLDRKLLLPAAGGVAT